MPGNVLSRIATKHESYGRFCQTQHFVGRWPVVSLVCSKIDIVCFSGGFINEASSYSEFGEVDLDKVKAAVKRFTHSCAGYSVATYILV